MTEAVKVSDLVLTDEHDTVGPGDSLVDATNKLLDLPRGVLIVVGDDSKVKGLVTSIQILQSVADGKAPTEVTCGDCMDSDVMEVKLSDDIDDIVKPMTERKPHAVVAVDDDGAFAGYFSPGDYREALSKLENRPAIRQLLAKDD